jgi:hypothetical protein
VDLLDRPEELLHVVDQYGRLQESERSTSRKAALKRAAGYRVVNEAGAAERVVFAERAATIERGAAAEKKRERERAAKEMAAASRPYSTLPDPSKSSIQKRSSQELDSQPSRSQHQQE